jgi:hypothetical protein
MSRAGDYSMGRERNRSAKNEQCIICSTQKKPLYRMDIGEYVCPDCLAGKVVFGK